MTPRELSSTEHRLAPRSGIRIIAPGSLVATIAWLCALAGVLAFASAPASALEAHIFSASFSGSGTNALKGPKGVAIDQSTGEVYVVDGANNRVEIFSSSGTFISAFGKKGTGDGEFTGPTEVAVDNSTGLPGDVYVIDNENNRVEVFNAKGEFQSQITKKEIEKVMPEEGPNFKSVAGVAVDNAGDLWIYVKEISGVAMLELPKGGSLKFDFPSNRGVNPGLAVTSAGQFWAGNGSGATHFGPSGESLEGLGFGESPTVTGLALNPANEDMYLLRGTVVAHFRAPTSNSVGPSDTFGSSGSGALAAGAGIAVDGATGNVYVADSTSNHVDVFTGVTEATVSLQAATGVKVTSATLNGTVNPEGLPVSSCQFEYGTEQGKFTKTSACTPAPGSGTEPVAVVASVSELTQSTTYHYRLSVTNANGTNAGGQEGTLKTAQTLAVSNSGSGAGEAECEVNASGHFEACAAEYAEGTALVLHGAPQVGSTFAGWSAGSGSASGCTGLADCALTITENSAITATFNAVAGVKDTLSLTKNGTGAGSIECEANASGHFEACAAEYAEGSKLVLHGVPDPGSTFAGWSAGGGSASTCTGTSDCSFTIKASSIVTATFAAATVVAPSEVETGGTHEVTSTSAMLEGKLNPGGGATYYFEYGETPCKETPIDTCGTKTSPEGGSLTGAVQEEAAPAQVLGLKPSTTYYYWIVATNSAGTVHGAQREVTTAVQPAMFPLTVSKYGEGTVTSDPAGIACGAGAACTAQFEGGSITLTEKPATGYEFAGWIGCKRIGETPSCEVDLTAASEVGAVFLKAGADGKEGATGKEGKEGAAGKEGQEGAAGKEGKAGAAGNEGKEGAAGIAGAVGPVGPAGPLGAPGPAGPTGAQGPAGPAGKVQLVTCQTVRLNGKKRQRCTTQLVSGAARFTVTGSSTQATLSRHGAVYATGAAYRVGEGMSLRLLPLRRLRPGRYKLTLIGVAGGHERIRSEPFFLSSAQR